MHALGLDVGSTSIKGAVLDLERGELSHVASQPFPAPLAGLPSGRVEIAPPAILEQVESLLDELLKASPGSDQLYFCGQMVGVILVDDNGRPISNYLSWRDQRSLHDESTGQSYLNAVRARWPANVLQELGNELQPGSATSLLYWLDRNGQLPAHAMPSTVTDFVISQLTGGSPRMHETQAIGMLNLRTSQWHREAWDLLGLSKLRLPELSHDVEPVGRLTRAGRTLQVFGAYGDQQSALRGAGLARDELSLNVSTGSQVSLLTSRFQPGRYQTRKFFGGDWLNTVTHLPAGRSLNVLVDLLTELAGAEGITLRNPWDYIQRAASEVRSTDLQVDLAFFAGPLGSSGSIQQITTENLTIGNLFQAAYRAMADNYACCADWLDPARSWKSVVLSGGLTQSAPALRTHIQQRFAAPIRESATEETLLGLLDIAKTRTASPQA